MREIAHNSLGREFEASVGARKGGRLNLHVLKHGPEGVVGDEGQNRALPSVKSAPSLSVLLNQRRNSLHCAVACRRFPLPLSHLRRARRSLLGLPPAARARLLGRARGEFAILAMMEEADCHAATAFTLRESGSLSGLPFLRARDDEESVTAARRAPQGCSIYLARPVPPQTQPQPRFNKKRWRGG